MKKLLSAFLCFVMSVTLGSSIYAEEVTYDYEITPELIEREKKLLDEIEQNLDEIHNQIEAYQIKTIQPYGISYGGFQYLDGDILVTKSTSSGGLTGHAGIIVGDKVLEITPGYNNGVPAAISLSMWFSRYPSTMVMRYTQNRDIPVAAAWYGHTFYIEGEGADNEYSIASSIDSLTKDYCSSLVWKCYHYGASFDYLIFDAELLIWKTPTIMLPYDFIVSSFAEHNGFTAVNSVNW